MEDTRNNTMIFLVIAICVSGGLGTGLFAYHAYQFNRDNPGLEPKIWHWWATGQFKDEPK